MAQLHLTFDLSSQSVTSASVDGRALSGAADILSVILAKGMASIINQEGRNLLEGLTEAPLDQTQAQLNIAKAFGFQGEGPRS